jgi:signal transduction histidine kinase
MIPRSLGGRLVAAFALLALAIVIAVGGALFVALRGLHQDATLGELNAVAGSVLPQVRDSIGTGQLRGTVLELKDQLADDDIDLLVIGGDGRLRPIGEGLVATSFGPVLLARDAAAGDVFSGTLELHEAGYDGRYLYVATALRRVGSAGLRAVAFVEADRSGALALADVGRTIPVVVVVILLIATPLAVALARSVTRPMRRIAAATGEIPAGRAIALPLEGPAEVRDLTGTFNAMSAEIEATRQRERDLLANLRHDLRTPLTVIAGFATALHDGTARGKSAEAAARAIAEEADRLERLVTEVGAVERIRSGEESIRPELLDAGEVLASTATRFGPRAAAAGVELGVATAPGSALSMAADRLALDRMLANLVENALVATTYAAATTSDGASPEARAVGSNPRGSIAIQAGPATLPGGVDAVRFDVIDDGPGFPDGTASRAFERLWRADPARAGTGSGLGLAIVQELAAAHGGITHVENHPPHGARVGFTLPRVPWPRAQNAPPNRGAASS